MLSEARLFMTPFSIPSTFKSLMSVFSVTELRQMEGNRRPRR